MGAIQPGPSSAGGAGVSIPREGTLADRGTASDYQGGTYLVTSGASLWSLWQSVLVSGTWTWLQRPYRVPTDTITSSGMLADWDFSALTRSSTTVTNAISPGTGDLSIGSTLQGRLQWSTVDPTTWQGLQSLPITASADESTDAVRDLATASGAPFKPAGDWTVALWVARNNAASYSPVGSLFALGSRIDGSTWGGPSNYFAVEVGVTSAFRPYAGVHHGGGPTYSEVVAGDPLTNGRLTLVTATYVASSGTLTLYVDGLQVATTTGLGAIFWGSATNRPWCVGGNIISTGATSRQAWPGWIGRVLVSGAAASAADVARHYARISERM